MKEKQYYVYIYKNPLKNNQPFYVGKGSSYRYKRHLHESSLNKDYHKDRVIKKILKNGLKPVVEVINCNSEEESLNLEIELIKKYGKSNEGGTLTNLLDGGTQPPKMFGSNNPSYGSGRTYLVTHIETGKETIVSHLWTWCKQNGLTSSCMNDIASRRVRYTKKGTPTTQKKHKGYTCKLLY